MIETTSMLLYGQSKIGKTTFAASAPNPRFIATESGHKYLSEEIRSRIRKLSLRADGWNEYMKLVGSEKGRQILSKNTKSIIVDTADNLYEMCMDKVCKDNGWTHPEEGAHGRGWRAVAVEFAKGVHALCDLCDEIELPLMFISHAKMEAFEAGTVKYSRIVPTLTGQAYKIIASAVDTVCLMAYDNLEEKNVIKHSVKSVRGMTETRCLWFGGSLQVEAGTRNPGVVDRIVSNLPAVGGFDYVCNELKKPQKEESEDGNEKKVVVRPKTGRTKTK